MPDLRTGTVEAGGVRSPLLEAGPRGAAEAVVFVHGNPGSSRDWTHLIERVGSHARSLAFDHPGFGRADKPQNFPYTVQGYARHLGEALNRLGVERAHLVLHDFGGPWGLAWAADNPHAFASVTLINTGILSGYRWHHMARIWRTPVLGELAMATTTRTAFRTFLRHGNPRGLPREFVDRMLDDFDRGTKRAVLRLYRATSDMGMMDELSRALRPLERPALVIWGRNDPYIPVRYAERQRETFPDAEVRILDDSGHWPFVDDPERVGRALTAFVRRVAASGGPG
jgi:pimeloyl-ACP methyl ester carboxylesterase